MEFGEILKSRRLELNLTQEELGNKTGLSKVTIHHYEEGLRKNPTIDLITSFANALNLAPSDLMNWDEKAPKKDTDIALKVATLRYKLDTKNGRLTLNGKPLSDEAIDITKSNLEYTLRQAQMMNNKYNTTKKDSVSKRTDRDR